MKQRCDEDYWANMLSMKPAEAPCGQEFDDAEQLTYCPHNELPPKMTEAEQEEALKLIREMGS